MGHRFAFGLSLAVLIASSAPAAAQQVLDLAGSSSQTAPASGAPVKFQIINRMPNKDYITAVVDRITQVDAFAPLNATKPAGPPPPCDDLLGKAKDLSSTGANAPAKETDVQNVVKSIRDGLASGTCTDSDKVKAINAELAKTTLDVSGEFTVADGHEVVLTVTRRDDSKLTWTLTVQGASRGKWLTTYGAAWAPNRDEKYFAKATGTTSQYAITAERAQGGLTPPMPVVFFTWLGRSHQDTDLAYGPTAGFGVEGGNRPTIFGGYSVTYNWNLGFVTGVAVVPELRLNGRYSPDQVVTENLAADALLVSVYRPRWFFAFTFRFGSNPFVAPTPTAPVKKP